MKCLGFFNLTCRASNAPARGQLWLRESELLWYVDNNFYPYSAFVEN